MTDHNPSAGHVPARSSHRFSVSDSHTYAVQLSGCLEALDHMGNEMRADYSNAIAAVTAVALNLANKLIAGLTVIEDRERHNA